MRGQLSVEMLVILVIILSLAALVASVLLKSANKAADKVEQKTDSVLNTSDRNYAAGAPGDYCTSDSDCRSGSCSTYSGKCL